MTWFDTFTQVWISVFGLAGLGLMQFDARSMRRAGVLCGIAGQPAWYAQLVLHDQWGMMPAYFGYSAVWALGFWNLWLRRPPATGADPA